MKLFIFSLAALLAASAPCVANGIAEHGDSANAADSLKYEKRIHRYRKHWEALIPTQQIVQYAGNMGFMSIGIGWNYGHHDQWETHLLFGLLPKCGSNRNKMTITIKETFIPWDIHIRGSWTIEPLSCGLYVNSVLGHEFWNKQPPRYDKGYYPFLSTKYRMNIFVGQQIEKTIPHNRRKFIKSITAFYEMSTCDLYIRAMVQDDYVKIHDILSLSLGLKFGLF